MKILSTEEANSFLRSSSVDETIRTIRQGTLLTSGPYAIPQDAGVKTALARQFADFLLGNFGEIILCLSGWKIWPSAENIDLFDGYRKSIGETRPVWEAPIHVFTRGEKSVFTSILNLGLFFYWDIEIFDSDSNVLFTFSHDEWMEFCLKHQKEVDQLTSELAGFDLKQFRRATRL
jgi:hypothetical protein